MGRHLIRSLATFIKSILKNIFKQFNVSMHYDLQPIQDIHLHSKLQYEPEELGSMSYIWIFSSVAFFMLLIACINYMNLTTARIASRAKEIGIRKVTGSSKRQLVAQFLGESLLTSFLAVLFEYSVGHAFIILCLTAYLAKTLQWPTCSSHPIYCYWWSIALFTGLVGGSYPAFYLSAFKPVGILKGALSKASGNISLRRTLVVLQFSISMIMLICTWVVYSQLVVPAKKRSGI